MSIMCGEIIFHHTPRFFFVIEKCSNPKYNKCSKLTLTQKIEEPHARAQRLVGLKVVWDEGPSLNIAIEAFCL